MPQTDPRQRLLDAATDPHVWDVIVIGGGASGLGTALEAATRGYRTLLLEAEDYAKGTSSRSTKLIHGGVRYLAQGDLLMVRESLRERARLQRNAPHLIEPLGFVIPLYRWRDVFVYRMGLWLYDLLAGQRSLPRSRWLGVAETCRHHPVLKTDGLKGSILYYDARFDDSRFAITLLRSLETAGGIALNAAPVTGFVKRDGRISGVCFTDAETDRTYEAQARIVINATGIFADTIRHFDDPHAEPMLVASQGAHLIVDGRFLPGGHALLVPKSEDGRVIFALPWHGRTLIGTTDTPLSAIEAEPRPLPDEIAFLLRGVAGYLDPSPHTEDIRAVFAGLRPLVASVRTAETKALSRRHAMLVSESGLLTLLGGKWTTYRVMGEEAIDRVETLGSWPHRASRTAMLCLHGGDSAMSEHWAVYGSDAEAIRRLPGAETRLHPDFPYTEAEIRWAVRMEQARSLEDALARRIRLLFLDAEAAHAAAPRAAKIMAEELGRDEAWQAAQLDAFAALVERYRIDVRTTC